MTKDELDVLWNRALRDAIKEGEQFTRYHFAALVAEKEREAAEPKKLFGYELWGGFYRTYDQAIDAFKDKGTVWATPEGVFNGFNEEWLKKNIREVYVHGTTATDKQ